MLDGGPCAFREEVAGANNGIPHAFIDGEGYGVIPPAVMENFQRIPSSELIQLIQFMVLMVRQLLKIYTLMTLIWYQIQDGEQF